MRQGRQGGRAARGRASDLPSSSTGRVGRGEERRGETERDRVKGRPDGQSRSWGRPPAASRGGAPVRRQAPLCPPQRRGAPVSSTGCLRLDAALGDPTVKGGHTKARQDRGAHLCVLSSAASACPKTSLDPCRARLYSVQRARERREDRVSPVGSWRARAGPDPPFA